MATYIHPTVEQHPLPPGTPIFNAQLPLPHPDLGSIGPAITRDIMFELEHHRKMMKDIRELMVELDKRVRRIETELKIVDQKETEGRKLDLG